MVVTKGTGIGGKCDTPDTGGTMTRLTPGATWIRNIHSQELIKEILDYCNEIKNIERENVLDEALVEINRVDATGECVHPEKDGCCADDCLSCVADVVIKSLRGKGCIAAQKEVKE
jgi:hypothetical protein